MAIPQINEAQLTRLKAYASGLGAFSQVVPVEEKDGKENYETYMETVRDTDQLVILGLVKDITEQCSVKVGQLFTMTGRWFRIYEITEVGKALFQGPDRTVQ